MVASIEDYIPNRLFSSMLCSFNVLTSERDYQLAILIEDRTTHK
jgi:hypothetical protein